MASEADKNAIREINHLITKMKSAWSSGHLNELTHYFHDAMKIVSPDLQVLGGGKDACVQSYIDFLDKAVVHDFSDEIANIYVFENTAIAFYRYNISWTMDDKTHQETGQEVYTFNYHQGR
ncbi:DUF4440 domain-containing protein [candidate division KSB1 bacterium]|nr:DUF4440 domain-containing protein [candidate division KSB1 bacterium]